MESLQLQRNDQISINELLTAMQQGHSVVRSAHVGNLSPYNLSLAAAGIPMLCVDHTITDVDTNYFPELSLSTESEQRIAGSGVIVSRAPLFDQSEGVYFLDQFHLSQIRSAIPNAQIFTNTDYLRSNESLVAEMIRLARESMPEQFTRVVMPDGTVKKVCGAADLVDTLGVLQLLDDPRAEVSAVIMPNLLDIVANFVIEALVTEQDTQYHLSGPDMVNYIKPIVSQLQSLYAVIARRASFRDKLPVQIKVQLIPSAEARFATTEERRPKLEGLLNALEVAELEEAELTCQRRAFFTSGNKTQGEMQVFNQVMGARKAVQERAVADAVAAIPELFVRQKEKGFVTQANVLNEGGLFVAPLNLDKSMSELTKTFKKLLKIHERGV